MSVTTNTCSYKVGAGYKGHPLLTADLEILYKVNMIDYTVTVEKFDHNKYSSPYT